MAAQFQKAPSLSPQEYLALERQAEYKSEYVHGEVLACAGASRWHTLIVTNLVGEFHRQLKDRPCNVYAQDLRVNVAQTSSYTYPDVIVVCGEEQFADEYFDTLLNPTLIVEVLSPTTTDYDRGSKFAHYRQLVSLQEYVIVAQEECLVEHFVRQPDHTWILSEFQAKQDTLHLPSIGCTLTLEEIYAKVEFSPVPMLTQRQAQRSRKKRRQV